MPYTMMIYLDEYEDFEIPKEGDTFIVVSVHPNTTDLHWGLGTHVELEPKEREDAKSKQVEE